MDLWIPTMTIFQLSGAGSSHAREGFLLPHDIQGGSSERPNSVSKVIA